MNYQVLAGKDSREIGDLIYKMLEVEEGDKLAVDLKNNAVVIRKIDNSAPLSCRSLTPEETGRRLLEAVESVEAGDILSEQEVWNRIEEERVS